MTLIERARQFAAQAHKDQLYGDEPYTVHTDEVVACLLEYNFTPEEDEEILAAGHLHDVQEDTHISNGEICSEFGSVVASIVDGVSKIKGLSRKQQNARYFVKVRQDPRRVAVKLADRIVNVRRCKIGNPGLFDMYRREYAGFKGALQDGKEFGGMWAELDYLFR